MRIHFLVACFASCGAVAYGAAAVAQSTGPAPGAVAIPENPSFTLVGNRFAPLAWGQMSEAQKNMMRHVLDGPRTGTGGPFNVMLRSPAMGDYAQELGAQVRFSSSLPPALREMAILILARHWTAQYEWNAHKSAALSAGLDPKIIAAIAAGERPSSASAAEIALYDFSSELLETKEVSDDTFAAAKAALGEQGVAETIFTLGYYGLVAMLLAADEYPLPDGVEPELRPLAH